MAPTNATVLITGETRTGKELVAESIHALSRRSREPFLAMNCGAVSAHIAESELFGHERGSFTGRRSGAQGVFRAGQPGDVVPRRDRGDSGRAAGEAAADLGERRAHPCRRHAVDRVDVRIVAANRRLTDAVALGKLREDLFYRLNVLPIHVPPLRERSGDAERLADHFLGELNASEAGPRSSPPPSARG